MTTSGVRGKLGRVACWAAAVLTLCGSQQAWAATAAQGRGYGLNVTASVGTVVGLTVPLGDTGTGVDDNTAPPDFHDYAPALDADVGVGLGPVNVLRVTTGDIFGKTDSALAQNTVASEGGVADLDVSAVGAGNLNILTLHADVVTAKAQYTCVAGTPTPTGTTSIVGLSTGGLVGVLLNPLVQGIADLLDIAPNSGLNVTVPLVASAGLMLNEQTVTGNKLTVRGLHLSLNVLSLIEADVTVGHAEASMPDCAAAPGSVTIAVPNINAANQAAVQVAGTCTVGAGSVVITTSPAGTPPVNQSLSCSSTGTYSTTVNASATGANLPDGSVTFTATQDSQNANTTVSKDTDVATPVVSVNPPPTINSGNASAYGSTISGTCTDGAGTVTVTIGGLPAANVPCVAGTWAVGTNVDVSSLPDGLVLINATQGSGNGSAIATKDTVPPTVTITTAPAINAANAATYTVSGSCSENGVPVAVTIGGISVPGVTCTAGQWTASQDVSGLSGNSVTITAAQTDAAGNSTTPPATRVVPMDLIPPVVTIETPAAIDASNHASYGVSGTCTAGDGEVRVTVGTLVTTAPCSGAGTWTVAGLNVASLPQGSVTITASQTDAAGNVGQATATADKSTEATNDTTPPTVTVNAPTITTDNQGNYVVSGTCTAGDGVVTVVIGSITVTATCNDDGSWATLPTDVSGLPAGPTTVTASQTDAAGNVGSAQVETTKVSPAANPTPVPVGGAWAGLLLLATGAACLRRRRSVNGA